SLRERLCAQKREVAGAARWELGAIDAIRRGCRRTKTLVRRGDDLIEPQRIVGIVNAEGSIHDRQNHLKFETSGGARLPVGTRDGPNVFVEGKILSADAIQTYVQSGTSESGAIERIQSLVGDAQLRLAQDAVQA